MRLVTAATAMFSSFRPLRRNFGARVVYTSSRDRGGSWSPPRAVTPLPAKFARASADKRALTVGADGSVHTCFTQVLTAPLAPRGLIVARSTDGGLTWVTRDTGVRDPFCNGVATAPGGTVTTTFITSSGYGTVTSTNGGHDWDSAVGLGQFYGLNLPSIVRDSSGRFVIAEVAGVATPRLDVSIENADGSRA